MYIKKVGWMPVRMDEVQTNYELQFGELYIRIKWEVGKQRLNLRK